MRIEHDNVCEAIAAQTARNPQRRAFVFINQDGAPEFLTAGEIHREALVYAAALRAVEVAPQQGIVLVMRHSRAVLSAFLGAMYLGATPSIFPYPTEKVDPDLYARRVRTVVAESGASAVISAADFVAPLREWLTPLRCRVVNSDDVRSATAPECRPLRVPAAESIALVQYTSGTTGLQKGVALTHRMIMNHFAGRLGSLPLTVDDVVVSWLPLYHDMGLISSVLLPLVTGITAVLMSPFHWVRDPVTLLRAVHEHRGTLSWMPNFAFSHCTRVIRDRDLQGIDLSSWRRVINGSEPVRHETIEQFYRRFAPHGLRATALWVGYGLAENVQTAAQTQRDGPPRVDWVRRSELHANGRALPAHPTDADAVALVSCGRPIPGTEIAIRNAAGAIVPERHVGRITLRSPYMCSGYHRRPDLTESLLRDGWLDTGDLGYFADGELHVCGRTKDTIIVAGRNLHPQDLECIANSIAGIQPGRAVAFGLPDARRGTEGIVMVCESRSEADATQLHQTDRELRRRVLQELDVALADVRFVRRGWIVKTSNGKLARAANREKYLGAFGRDGLGQG